MAKAVNLKWEKKLLTTKSARAVALDTLMRVFRNNSYSNLSLNNALKRANLSQTDCKFATKLVYGTIQYKIYLKFQLQDLIRTKLKEGYIEPLLLMSAYQILFLDKVPNRAVLNEANILAKEFGRLHSTGFKVVNGILRSLIRRGPILPKTTDKVTYLSIKESTPKWLVQYLIDHWGNERAAKVLASINEPAKNTIRISRLVNKNDVKKELVNLGFSYQESKLTSDELILNHGGISSTKLFQNGLLTIQDEAASLAVNAFDFEGNEQVLDACSAPGGKTVQIAEQVPLGNVIALDIHQKKLNLVEQNSFRMGVEKRINIQELDARQADRLFRKGQFDKILVDAPCSGLGLLRRKPEIRYNKSLSDLTNLQKIQSEILEHVKPLLRVNGELIYSTCSIAQEEDEDVVNIFLKKHPEVELKPFKTGKISVPTGLLKIMPDSYHSDGFFISKFVVRG